MGALDPGRRAGTGDSGDPALCHLYIHTMEAGPEAARAVPVAENLETLTPGLGHLIHMPSHIYTWTGRYEDVIRVNQRAMEVDRAFVGTPYHVMVRFGLWGAGQDREA